MDGQPPSTNSIAEEPSYLKPLEQECRKKMVTISENIQKRFSFSLHEADEETIAVLLRIKPEDKATTKNLIYNEVENSVTIKKSNKADHCYTFTHVFPPEASQPEVFEKCAKNKIQRLLDGLSSFIFTFGASNSGKTFTVQGDRSNPGLVPRSLVALLTCLKNFIDESSPLCPDQASSVVMMSATEISQKNDYKNRIISLLKSMLPQISKTEAFIPYHSLSELNFDSEDLSVKDTRGVYSVWLSFYEIYNEKIFDLLDEPKETKAPLRLVSDKSRVSYIKDLKYIQVNNLQEAYEIYLYGRYNLSISSTAVNDRSSRSHSIFSIKLIGRPKVDDSSYFQHSSLSICDLAGTERAHRTRNVGLRLKESQQINTSFLVLNKCLRIIRDNQSTDAKKLVPYRESKLTQILGPSLTSKEATLTMIVAISQDTSSLEETEGTLKSSSVATSIVIHHSPPQRKAVRKTRFSMAISNCAPGESVGWTAIASQLKESNDNLLEHPDGLKKCVQDFKALYPTGREPDVYKELLEERKTRRELEEKISEMTENHRKELQNLKDALKQKASQEPTEDLKRDIKELEEESVQLTIELLKVRKAVRVLKEEKEQLLNEKKNVEQLNKTLEKLLDDAKDEVEALQEDINSLDGQINAKDYLLSLKEEEIESLKQDKLTAEENIQLNIEEMQSYEEQIGDLETEKNNLRQEVATLTKKLQILSGDLINVKNEKVNDACYFSKQLQNAQEENEILRKRIAELEVDSRYQVPVIELSEEDNSPYLQSQEQKGKKKKANYALRSLDPPVISIEEASDDECIVHSTQQKIRHVNSNDELLTTVHEQGSRRTRSADRRGSSSEDDPEFCLPRSYISRTTLKKRTKSKKQLPEYFEDKSSLSAPESSANVKIKKQLFLRTSVDLGNDGDQSKSYDLSQTQASPGTIIKRTLRARKK